MTNQSIYRYIKLRLLSGEKEEPQLRNMLRLHGETTEEAKEETPSEENLPGSSKRRTGSQRKQETNLKKSKKRIQNLKHEIKRSTTALVLPDVCTNVGRCAELSREKRQDSGRGLEELYEKWEELASTADFFSPNITKGTVSQLIQ